MTKFAARRALIVGASRGLGLAMAAEYVGRGWRVTATVRGDARTGLHDLSESSGGRLTVETVDVAVPEQVAALRERVAGSVFDLVFVNAAMIIGDLPFADVPTETFNRMMVTNALGPVRLVEAFRDLVTPLGTIGVMSSSQGSITLNDPAIPGFGCPYDVYRASKSALNQLMRSYAARHADDPRTLLLINPGHCGPSWVVRPPRCRSTRASPGRRHDREARRSGRAPLPRPRGPDRCLVAGRKRRTSR